MKWPTKKDRRSDLQKELDRVHAGMQLYEVDSPKYKELLETYHKLEEMKMKRKSRFPSGDTILQGLVVIGGIELIKHYEQLHVFTSKAIGLIPKITFRRG